MLYLRNITGAQSLEVPRPGAVPEGDLTFQARSTINLDVVMDLQVLDLKMSNQYFFLAVQVPEGAPNGEYQYIISVGGEVVTTGILVLCEEGAGFTIVDEGEFQREQTYQKIKYEQYERR